MQSTVTKFNQYLREALDRDASDVHVKTGKKVQFRISGNLRDGPGEPISKEEIRSFVETVVPAKFRMQWESDSQVDFAYSIEGMARFRVNGFYQRGVPGIVFRLVKDTPPTFESLNHDGEVLRQLCQMKDGVILVCGPTGAGKSSTLAGMINYLNARENLHIVTLEDPIEFIYADEKCMINQREIGIDTPNFAQGLRAALRQDPDVILIGEMRDRESFEIALQAAETGHLVLSTLHASHAQQAVRRLFEFFPESQRDMMKRQVADSLRAIVVQRLVSNVTGSGRLPVVERFIIDAIGRRVIADGAFEKILSVIESSEENGSITFNRDLYRRIKAGSISKDEGLFHSPNAKQLEMNLKGIFLSSGGIVGS
ncbi:MAG: type IV pilus twitching motility protein PilT [Puniceicoccaceae bacterium]